MVDVLGVLKNGLKDLGSCLERLCGEVAELERSRCDHDRRLQELEEWRREISYDSIVSDLKRIERRIETLPVDKQPEALATFKKLCDLLGVIDLEDC